MFAVLLFVICVKLLVLHEVCVNVMIVMWHLELHPGLCNQLLAKLKVHYVIISRINRYVIVRKSLAFAAYSFLPCSISLKAAVAINRNMPNCAVGGGEQSIRRNGTALIRSQVLVTSFKQRFKLSRTVNKESLKCFSLANACTPHHIGYIHSYLKLH